MCGSIAEQFPLQISLFFIIIKLFKIMLGNLDNDELKEAEKGWLQLLFPTPPPIVKPFGQII